MDPTLAYCFSTLIAFQMQTLTLYKELVCFISWSRFRGRSLLAQFVQRVEFVVRKASCSCQKCRLKVKDKSLISYNLDQVL